ncbi:hypothetical protein L596_024939 [Steinernema carpocapsae]|uniref:Uncharacterized protein n=1 Tax=Steinernema carpocapsae TaxID=34508 RepID=A0A4U5M6B3_STECR|nr:hypothetical protein L596_024939 [Steinernema carpocapsae]
MTIAIKFLRRQKTFSKQGKQGRTDAQHKDLHPKNRNFNIYILAIAHVKHAVAVFLSKQRRTNETNGLLNNLRGPFRRKKGLIVFSLMSECTLQVAAKNQLTEVAVRELLNLNISNSKRYPNTKPLRPLLPPPSPPGSPRKPTNRLLHS